MVKNLVGRSILVVAVLVSGVLAGSGQDAVKAGNDAFDDGQYDEAMARYQVGEAEAPESPQLYYNIANLMYEMGKYEEALDHYSGALESEDAQLHARANYNMGNTYFRMGDYAEAINSYTKAIELTPDDLDAKLNLELSRKMLKEQMKPENQEQQDQENKEEQEKQEKEDQDKQDKQDKQDQREQQDQDQEQEEQQQNQDQQQDSTDQQQQQQQQPEKQISKEDAERILNALKDDEQEIQKKIKRQVSVGNYTGNDW
jgi:tetratricopeptide (TPR) repeat protein